MKTKNIFKTLAAAMLMPAMLLTTACSSEDDFAGNENTENAAKKGYTMPVTVNVTRQGDDATTRATFNSETKKLEFSTGDQLFVKGYAHPDAGEFAGTLDYDGDGKFSGNIITENKWTGTVDDLFKDGYAFANLLPAGYEDYGYLSIANGTSDAGYDDYVYPAEGKAFAKSKAIAVEQFSNEGADYTSGSGFALSPQNAILNFTISGLAKNTEVTVVFTMWGNDISRRVETDDSGNATFAIGIYGDSTWDNENFSLTVDGNAITLVSERKELKAGKIYNINRSAAPAGTDLSKLTADYVAQDGETLTGTLAGNYKITIADGATVTLDGLTINGTNDSRRAGLTLAGDATIILSGENTVKGFYEDYPGIYVPENKTLTIKGDGSLTASSNGYGAGIGGGNAGSCGTITISGGTINATGGMYAAGIGTGMNGSCGSITIEGGEVIATGGEIAAGIGTGVYGSCGDASNSIGEGEGGTVNGKVTIDAGKKVTQN